VVVSAALKSAAELVSATDTASDALRAKSHAQDPASVDVALSFAERPRVTVRVEESVAAAVSVAARAHADATEAASVVPTVSDTVRATTAAVLVVPVAAAVSLAVLE
jgi:hypothetical protein